MTEIRYIELKRFCEFHEVEHDLIIEIAGHGLIELDERSGDYYLPEPSIPKLERMLRLHIDLGVNILGVETIIHMRQRMMHMQEELVMLRRQIQELIDTYEDNEVEEISEENE